MDRIIKLPKKKLKLLDFKKKQTFGNFADRGPQKQVINERKNFVNMQHKGHVNLADINPFESTFESLFSRVNSHNRTQIQKFAASNPLSPNMLFPNKQLQSKNQAKKKVLEDLQLLCDLTESHNKNQEYCSQEIFKEMYNNSLINDLRSPKKVEVLQKSEFIEKHSDLKEQKKINKQKSLVNSFKEFLTLNQHKILNSSLKKLNSQIKLSKNEIKKRETLIRISDLRNLTNQINDEIDLFLETKVNMDIFFSENQSKIKQKDIQEFIKSNSILGQNDRKFLESLCDLKKKFSRLSLSIERGSVSTDQILSEVKNYHSFCKRVSRESVVSPNKSKSEFGSLLNLACTQLAGQKYQDLKKMEDITSLNFCKKILKTSNRCSLASLSKPKEHKIKTSEKLTNQKINSFSKENNQEYDKIQKFIPFWEKSKIYFQSYENKIIYIKTNNKQILNNEGNQYFSEHKLLKPEFNVEIHKKNAVNQQNIEVICPLIKLNRIIKKHGTKNMNKLFKTKEMNELNMIQWNNFELLQNK
jgi:hypothetical protein